MSDDRTPLRDERAADLAAAYLDGHATAQERAEVEASPVLLALVDTFRVQATELRTVPAPSAASRDAAIAAALAAALPAAAPLAPPPPANVVALRRSRRLLTIAAGVAAAGVLGVVGVASFGDGSDRGSAGTQADTMAGEAANIATGSDTKEVSDSRTSEVVPTAEGDAGTLGPIVGPSSALTEVNTDDELRAIGVSGGENTFVTPSFELQCPLPENGAVIAEISWRGTPALVLRDTVSGQLTAIDAQCTTLATVTP